MLDLIEDAQDVTALASRPLKKKKMVMMVMMVMMVKMVVVKMTPMTRDSRVHLVSQAEVKTSWQEERNGVNSTAGMEA